MALKLPIPFPVFAPQLNLFSSPSHCRPPSEVHFSRWNNANAEKFEQRRRSIQEIEDQIRRDRLFESAARISRISSIDESVTTANAYSNTSTETFRSRGTPSSPSKPSIPGKKSKYSKNPTPDSHPAFLPPKQVKVANATADRPVGTNADVKIGEDGISYVIDGAPFEFKYSYTETPKVKPIKLREPFAPFGPTTMPRPWTGRAPLPPSKKKLKEFDSFQLPPPNKKGVKPVQAPGPFLAGSGPKYVYSREQILGEPLTAEEIKELVDKCQKSNRQLNMGRDGLTHNMLDNIHAHWKRRRVCKIKCKGVCTVDMDNVHQQLEEKSGGKIIYSKGGVIYIFRGRNYNYKTRPRFPLMLWKPVTPVYPRLVQRAPEGLTLEDATEMRKKGRNLTPICKLGKNGVYSKLVKHVREAFEVCELVRINCQGMNGSDFHKIGAKLRDLVPCILISFESEHILIWRGRDWKSSLSTVESTEKPAGAAIAGSFEGQSTTANYFKISAEANEDAMVLATGGSGAIANEGNIEKCNATESVSSVAETFSTVTINKISGGEAEISMEACENVNMGANTICDNDTTVRSPTSGSNVLDAGSCAAVEGNESSVSDTMSRTVETTENKLRSLTENPGPDSVSGLVENTEIMSESSVEILESGSMARIVGTTETKLGTSIQNPGSDTMSGRVGTTETKFGSFLVGPMTSDRLQDVSESCRERVTSPCSEVLVLLKQAVDNGSALILEEPVLDADIIYQRAVDFARSAPPGPVFQHLPRKIAVKINQDQATGKTETADEKAASVEGDTKKKSPKSSRKNDFGEHNLHVPHGSLRVDELAKLLG